MKSTNLIRQSCAWLIEPCLLGEEATAMAHVDEVDDGVGYGVSGKSNSSSGVLGGSGNSAGLYGESSYDYAAVLNGKVKITGNLEKAGGSLKIGHPLDPDNKY